MADFIKISSGTVYDPTNGIDGEVGDLWIADGKIVAAPADPSIRPTRRSMPGDWSSCRAASICTAISRGRK